MQVEALIGSLFASILSNYIFWHHLILYANFVVLSVDRSKRISFADDLGGELSQSTYVADLHYSSGARMGDRKPGGCCVVS